MNKNGIPYTIDHIPRTTKMRRPGTVRKPRTITIHSTGNPRSTARNERGWLTNPSNGNEFTGWHVCIDEREAIEAIPLNEVAYHAGDGNGPGNSFSIGVEICESGNRAKTLLNAAKVVAALLRENGLGVGDLRQHFDWNRKNCPSILRTGNLWQEFITSVQAWLNFEEVDPLKEAIDFFVAKGVVSSPDYWLQHARAGKMVKGENVAAFLVKSHERLRR